MSWITDIFDYILKLKPYDIVDEGQAGICLRGGIVIDVRRRDIHGNELEGIVKEEKKIIDDAGGAWKFMGSIGKHPKIPAGYRYGAFTGLPKHPKRYDKDLKPGLYWVIPFLETIYTDHNQDRRIVSKPEDIVIVPTTDKGNVALGFVMVQNIADYYRAYTKGDDYEDLLRGEASSTVAKLSSGKSIDDWTHPSLYKEIADETLGKLRKYTNLRWGVNVSNFSLTPIIINPFVMISYGGTQPGISINETSNGTSTPKST